MLEIRELAVAYGDLQVIWNVSLEVQAGEIVVLIGSNGAGKTTFLQTVAGLHRPLSGSILLENNAIHTMAPHQIVERGLILVPEGRRLFGGMTVLENLELGAFTARARQKRQQTLPQVYDLFPILYERRNQRAATLSGGQQQMLAIGRALMGLPRLLMLDEPSLGLAPLLVQHIFAVVRNISQAGATVLLVEQNARLALDLAHRAYIVEQGRIVGQGTGAELLADQHVRRAYLGYEPAAGDVV
ncbi:MAG: ABC transporter ATP-binding protein [Chloroflexi bacterium]|nr:ABC transporter ATP-binding protein [Chloroflexota bacterium]MCI0576307.1 ABC transporter ATP-binding protein [Chloroflexota bacterium]MCI0650024.1 ABC transporter ATP-binding protein [Chloroflexota bacterium]MCI0730492.1 ABC transporter ATP-binding protein [Chloroflexota bacterium]